MTVYFPDLIAYVAFKDYLLEKGMFFINTGIEASRGANYLYIGEKSFKQITKQEYENYQQ